MGARSRLLSVVLVSVGMAGLAISPADAADNDRKALAERIVAKADKSLLQVLVTRREGDGRPSFQTIKVASLAQAKDVVRDQLGKPGVRAVEMDRKVRALVNDPKYPKQWALDSKHLRFATVKKMVEKDSGTVAVAVVDSGVQGDHVDLKNRMLDGYDTTGLFDTTKAAATDNDDCGHGTHVAGIIAAQANNGRGIVGLAQRFARIRSVKVLGWDGEGCTGPTSDVVAGIRWAADNAQVINLSFGADEPSAAEQNAIDYAIGKGRVVVAAAGNCTPGTQACKVANYPANYPGVLGVAATGKDNKRASFSVYGKWVDVSAPGASIYSTIPVDSYLRLSGTSMATPYVSAAAALAIKHCKWSASTTVSKLKRTASHPKTWGSKTGWGVIRPSVLLRC